MPAEIDTSLDLYDTAARVPPLLFEHGEALPTGRRTALMASMTPPSVLDRLAQAIEALYGALKDGADLPDAAIVVCAQCAFRMFDGGYHFVDRYSQIYQVCRRVLGLTADAATPDPESDPEPRPLPAPPPE